MPSIELENLNNCQLCNLYRIISGKNIPEIAGELQIGEALLRKRMRFGGDISRSFLIQMIVVEYKRKIVGQNGNIAI